jgi:Nicotinate phosphoribosyltransferase (NAPRTase) family
MNFAQRAQNSSNALTRAIAMVSSGRSDGLLGMNMIQSVDTYKRSQMPLRAKDGAKVHTQSYGEARLRGAKQKVFVSFGFVQQFAELLPYMRVTSEMLAEAILFGEIQNMAMEPREIAYWQSLIDNFDGWPQFKMSIVPEGTVMNTGAPVYVIEAFDEHAFWPQYLEDIALRPCWFDSGIATRAHELRKDAIRFCKASGEPIEHAYFMVNDFGLRGSNTDTSARYAGSAVLTATLGTDNINAIRNGMYYYGTETPCLGFSAKATEHQNSLKYGPTAEGQKRYIIDTIMAWRGPNVIISLVMDGIDFNREVTTFCTDQDVQALVRETAAMGCKIVLRPDSNCMYTNVKFALGMLCDNYGYVTNDAGFRKPALNLGVIQGDGINDVSFNNLYGDIISHGYAAGALVTGSGGWLLNIMRDDNRVAQKMCFWVEDGIEQDVSKKTLGKESFGGLLSCYRGADGQYRHYDVRNGLPDGGVDVMVPFIDNINPQTRGMIIHTPSMDEVRANTGIW